MSIVWEYRALHEAAYSRRARLIVELIDPVTLDPVHDGLRLEVEGLQAKAQVSSGGRFVWFHEKGGDPKILHVDTGRLPYLLPDEIAIPPLPPPPAPPALPVTHTFLRVALAPSTAYPFVAGITALRGNLIENLADDPLVPVAGAGVKLRWIDDNAPGEQWVDAPTTSVTSNKGDFAAMVRLAPNQIARADAGHRMRVRVAATRAGNTRLSPELQIPFHRATDVQPGFAWDDLQP
jgi:hypothetical protein